MNRKNVSIILLLLVLLLSIALNGYSMLVSTHSATLPKIMIEGYAASDSEDQIDMENINTNSIPTTPLPSKQQPATSTTTPAAYQPTTSTTTPAAYQTSTAPSTTPTAYQLPTITATNATSPTPNSSSTEDILADIRSRIQKNLSDNNEE
jgi:hypothetical protein